MPRPPKPKITAWSFSRWSTYEPSAGGCPRLAKYRYVEKRDEPPAGKAAVRGQKIHDIAEAYVAAKRKPKRMPEELETFSNEFVALRRESPIAEQQLAFTENWDGLTEWFDPDVWVRVKVDAFSMPTKISGRVIDYKTGQIRPVHEKQLSLYALAGFVRYPEIHTISAELWYLDHGVQTDLVYDRTAHFEVLRADWAKKTKAMLADRRFDPNPGPACRFCPWSQKKGGPCEY